VSKHPEMHDENELWSVVKSNRLGPVKNNTHRDKNHYRRLGFWHCYSRKIIREMSKEIRNELEYLEVTLILAPRIWEMVG
jgi:hypothetical protein